MPEKEKKKQIKLKPAWKLEQEGRWFMAKPYELASNPDPISLYSQSSAKNIVVVIRKGSGESAPIEIYFKARAPTSKAFEVLPLHTLEGEIDREARGELPLALSKVTYRYYTKVRLSHRLYPLISPAAMTNAGSQGGVMSNPHFERLYDTLADVDLDIQDTAIFFAACAFSRTQHYGINKLLEVADRRVTNAKKNRTSISGYNDPQLIKDKLGKEPLYVAEMVIGTNDPANIRKVLEALPRNGNAFFIKHGGPCKMKDAEKILKWKLNRGSAISTWGQIKSDLFNKPTIREKIILNVEELQLLLRLPRNPTSYPFDFGVPLSRIKGVPIEEDIKKGDKAPNV